MNDISALLIHEYWAGVFPRKIWEYLNSPEGIKRFKDLRRNVTWGPSLGWKNHPVIEHDEDAIAPSGAMV